MSKGIEKPSSDELFEDLKSLLEINERIDFLHIVRLKELIYYLKYDLRSRLFHIYNENLKEGKSLSYCSENVSFAGFKYDDLTLLENLIQSKINLLTEKRSDNFKDLVFKDAISERFLSYLIHIWLKEEINKVTALRYIFHSMWYRNENSCQYKITCHQTYFAREYWNKYYSDILELNPKNPKLNQDYFTDYYVKRFEKNLNEFDGV